MNSLSNYGSSGQKNLDILRKKHSHLDFVTYQDGLVKNELFLDFIKDFQDSFSGWHECLFLSSWGKNDEDGWIPIVYLKSSEEPNMYLELIFESEEEITLYTGIFHTHLDPEFVHEVFLAVINEDKVLVSEFQGNRWRGSKLTSPEDITIPVEGAYTFQPLGCMMFAQPSRPKSLKIRSWKGTYNQEIEF